MPFWMEIYFMDANSPTMEQLIFFHDYSMISILSILMLLLMNMISTIKNNFLNLFLMENQIIEMIWTIFPMMILLLIGLPSLRLLYLMEELFMPNMTIKVIGHQWYWTYEFSDFNLSFDSFMTSKTNSNNFRLLDTDTSLFIPMNSSIRVLVSSSDVIHAWTIQSLGVKSDALPGRLNQLNLNINRPGVFYGQCSEICGSNHSFMPIKLKISNMSNFENFLKTNPQD